MHPLLVIRRGMIISKTTLPVGVPMLMPRMGVASTWAISVTLFMSLEIDDDTRLTVVVSFMLVIAGTPWGTPDSRQRSSSELRAGANDRDGLAHLSASVSTVVFCDGPSH